MSTLILLPETVVIAFQSFIYFLSRPKRLAKAHEITSFHNFSLNRPFKVLHILSKHNMLKSVKEDLLEEAVLRRT